MTVDMLKILVTTAILLLVQALILNHIHLFNYATPLLYVYIVLMYPQSFPKWTTLTWSFLVGLCADSFVNTPGVAAASMTFIALLQPYVLGMFAQQDDADNITSTIESLGWEKYSWYALTLIVTYCLIFFTIETFNFFNWLQWLISVGACSALTFLLIIVIENIRKN